MSNDKKNKSETLMQKVVKSAIINIVVTTLVLTLVFCLYNETLNLVESLTDPKTLTSQENKKFLNLFYQTITYNKNLFSWQNTQLYLLFYRINIFAYIICLIIYNVKFVKDLKNSQR
ncbi:MAG: hypothetical protein AB3N34_02550 [Lettuce witches'-broom phytoplasma]